MSEDHEKTSDRASAKLAKICYAIGGFSLIAAMGLDFLSVAGRRLGFPIIGSVELVQYCITGIVSAAIVVATLADNHAAAHVVTERLSAAARARARAAFGCDVRRVPAGAARRRCVDRD